MCMTLLRVVTLAAATVVQVRLWQPLLSPMHLPPPLLCLLLLLLLLLMRMHMQREIQSEIEAEHPADPLAPHPLAPVSGGGRVVQNAARG